MLSQQRIRQQGVGSGRGALKARAPSAPTGRVCMEGNPHSLGSGVVVTCMTCICVCEGVYVSGGVCLYVTERERSLATEGCLEICRCLSTF